MQENNDLSELLNMSEVQKELLSALIGLVRAAVENSRSTGNTAGIVTGALLALKNGDDATCLSCLQKVRQEKLVLAPDCAVCASPCGRTADYPMKEFCAEPAGLCELKAKMFFHLTDEVRRNAAFVDFESICRRLFMFGYAKDVESMRAFLEEDASRNR